MAGVVVACAGTLGGAAFASGADAAGTETGAAAARGGSACVADGDRLGAAVGGETGVPGVDCGVVEALSSSSECSETGTGLETRLGVSLLLVCSADQQRTEVV